MNRFAPIRPACPEPRPVDTRVPPFVHLGNAPEAERAMDDTLMALSEAAFAGMNRAVAAFPLLASAKPADFESQIRYVDLKLGEALVRVGYIMIGRCPLIQGIELPSGWVDADLFSRSVTAQWRREIERAGGEL